MKSYYRFTLIIFTVLLSSCGNQTEKTGSNAEGLKGNIAISGAFGLYPLAQRWGAEFSKIHPGVTFDISAGGAGKGMADVLSGNADIGMLSRDVNPEEIKKDAFPIGVAKDAVIPTFSGKNPYKEEILKTGLTKEIGIQLWKGQAKLSWEKFAKGAGKEKVEVFTRSDAAGAAETWAKYLGLKQEDLAGTAVYGDPGLAQAVIKNKFSIGYNNVAYIYDPKTRLPHEGLLVVPIDLNGDGNISAEENFYSNVDEITKAIAEGKYPSPPARELFFVTKGKPTNPLVIEFFKWVLTDGQKYVKQSGYVDIPKAELENNKKLIQ